MCGIAGIFQKNVNNYSQVCKAINAINHRGPDAKGVWYDEFISMGMDKLRSYGIKDYIIYDVKGIFNINETNGRL